MNGVTKPCAYEEESVDGSVSDSPVREQLDQLERATSELDSVIASLESMLAPVLYKEPRATEADTPPPVPEPPLCSLGGRIREQRQRLTTLQGQLLNVLQTIQL